MKNLIICAFAIGVLAAAGCSMDDETGIATVGDNTYTLVSALAYQSHSSEDEPAWSDYELYLGTKLPDENNGIGNCFIIDLYWEEDVRDRLVEGTYTLGDGVLGDVAFEYDDLTPETGAQNGTLNISRTGDDYTFTFSGTSYEGSKIEFS